MMWWVRMMPTFVTVILWALVFVQFCVSGFLYGMVRAVIKRLAELSCQIKDLQGRIPPYQVASFGGTHSGEGQKRPYQ